MNGDDGWLCVVYSGGNALWIGAVGCCVVKEIGGWVVVGDSDL